MSPLAEFKSRWAAQAMPLPLMDVVNTEVDLDDMPDLWAGPVLQSEERVDLTLGSNPWVEERGTIMLALCARSGQGENLLDASVAAVREKFHGWLSADLSIQFSAVTGPENTEPEANGEWWILTMRIPYTLQSRRSHPVAA
jgi:hypothetical protein